MVLRHSTIHIETVNPESREAIEAGNVMSYKCPGRDDKTCGWFIRFYVTDNRDYLKNIIDKFRCGDEFFVPVEDFKNHEIIKERLAALGYF